MRKTLLLSLILSMAVLTARSQSVTVSDFHLDESDPTANLQGTTVLDRNGEKCALIKIETTKTGFTYDVGLQGVQDTKQKTGQIWVYVPQGVKRITLNHPIYAPYEYYFPIAIERARTYVMKLYVSEDRQTQQLNISYSPVQATLLLDGELVEASNGRITMEVLQGVHQYHAVASGYASQSGTIKLNGKYPYNLNINLPPNPRPLAVIDRYKPVQAIEKDSLQQTGETNEDQEAFQSRTFTVEGVSFTMVPVDGGIFMMGATSEQEDPDDDELPTHQVTLSNYYIGETEVTQALWEAVMKQNPALMQGSNRPVEYVTWPMCQTFITQLSALTGQKFRLPTEAEWEFAARGGNKTKTTQYSGSASLHLVGWDTDNSSNVTHDVKSRQANELGIYDMSGNVAEWCQDWMGTYTSTPQTDPAGPMSGQRRVVRGGSWNSYSSSDCRVTARSSNIPEARNNSLGFRLALTPEQ